MSTADPTRPASARPREVERLPPGELHRRLHHRLDASSRAKAPHLSEVVRDWIADPDKRRRLVPVTLLAAPALLALLLLLLGIQASPDLRW